MRSVHASETLARQLSDFFTMVAVVAKFRQDQIYASYEPLHMNEHCHSDASHRYNLLQALKGGLSIPVVHLTYKTSNNVGDLVETLRPNFPTFSTRAMRKTMFTTFRRISSVSKPSVLCCYYSERT